MISRKKFHITEHQEVRIELSDLTLFELFRDVMRDMLHGTIELLKIDSLLYLLHFTEFVNGIQDRRFLQEAEYIMLTGAYESKFGYNRLADLLCELRARLKYDYFSFGTIVLTRDNLLVNDKLHILPVLD